LSERSEGARGDAAGENGRARKGWALAFSLHVERGEREKREKMSLILTEKIVERSISMVSPGKSAGTERRQGGRKRREDEEARSSLGRFPLLLEWRQGVKSRTRSHRLI